MSNGQAVREVGFTPGPWRWMGRTLVADYGKRPVVLTASLRTRRNDGTLRDLDPSEPIALLIAEAPVLFQAVIELIAAYRVAAPEVPGHPEPEFLRRARAAIARVDATGIDAIIDAHAAGSHRNARAIASMCHHCIGTGFENGDARSGSASVPACPHCKGSGAAIARATDSEV